MQLAQRRRILETILHLHEIPSEAFDLEESALCWDAEIQSTSNTLIGFLDFLLSLLVTFLGPQIGCKIINLTPLRSWLFSLTGMSIR